jgi:prepilin-type N-terminal cleavage/methylation domain-containing protein
MLKNLLMSSGESSSANPRSDSPTILRNHRVFWKSPGFTALELVIAIAILAILLVIAIPLYSGFLDRQSLRVALSQLEADLRNVQQRAKASGLVLAVEFNPTDNTRYRIYDYSSSKTVEYKKLPAGVSVSHTSMAGKRPYNTLVYYAAWQKSETDGGTVYLRSSGNRLAKVVIATITGRIRIEDL